MSDIVVDASITATWFLHDEANATGQWVLDQARHGTAFAAPALWLLEATNLLATAERHRRISREGCLAAYAAIEELPFRILAPPGVSDMPALDRLMRLHQLTAYDAEYVRVCKVHRLALASLDRRLMAAARREGIVWAVPPDQAR